MEHAPSDHREAVAWILVGTLITALAAFVLYSFFGALVTGVFLYYATRPVYRWLNDRIDHPDVNAMLTLLTVGLPILIILGYAALLGIREVDQLLVTTDLEEFRTIIEPYVDLVPGTDGQGLLGLLRGNVSQVTGLGAAIVTWMLRIFVIVTLAFYLLRDDYKIAGWFRRSFEDHPRAVTFMEHVDDDLTTIYTGNLVTIGTTGLIAVAVYVALDAIAPSGTGLGFPVLLGLLIGVATLVPAVGMKLVYFPYTALLAWRSVTSGAGPLWFPIAFFVVTLVVIDTIPDIFIRSYFSKGNLNMGLLVLTYVLGSVAFGWYGVFFGPIVLVLFVHFARDVLPLLLDPDDRVS